MTKLAGLSRYLSDDKPFWGVLKDEIVYPLKNVPAERVQEALSAGTAESLLQQATFAPIENPTLLPPLLPQSRVFCVGLNFGKHIAETGRELPEHPVIFSRTRESLVGHGQSILCPPESIEFDYEGEVALVIGKPGRRIVEAQAHKHIAGYTLANDGTIRDWQFHTHQYLPGKNFDASGGLGPAIFPKEVVGDLNEATLRTRVSGTVLQSAPLSDLIFPFAKLVAYCSTFTALRAGDVILTGTPDGVGFKRDPKRFLIPGDIAEILVDGLPPLMNPVAQDTAFG